jgi:hypothetical protein
MAQGKETFRRVVVEGAKDDHDGLDQVVVVVVAAVAAAEAENSGKGVCTWPQGTWGVLDVDRP